MEIRLCKDCKHFIDSFIASAYVPGLSPALCAKSKILDVVYGENAEPCRYMRTTPEYCSPSGKWWEAKSQ